MTLLRAAVRQSYGIGSEQLAKFGIQPFRGRKRKADEAPVIASQPARGGGLCDTPPLLT